MRRFFFSTLLGIGLCGIVGAQTFPYQDRNLTSEQRAEDLLTRLTLEQKAGLMVNESQAIPEFGINAYGWWNEALHGAARAGLATVFPQSIGMAASWDDALLKDVFDIASTEQRIKYIQFRRDGGASKYHGLTVWTPNINIFRDPRWGRGQETYGEDPYLTARMGWSVVTGLQGEKKEGYDKLHACLKHFAVHSGPEPLRHQFNVEGISMRDLRETYLFAFENLVKTTDVREVMCAYQRLDGQPCCGNDQLLNYFLREKWGYKGIVVSDCGAIDDFYKEGRHETYLNDPTSAVSRAVITGTDLECGSSYRHLVDAVKEGKITEAQIDKSLKRLLVARFDLGEMDYEAGIAWDRIPEDLLACEEHHKVALKMTQETMVLLQNNGTLPLAKAGRYFITGPNAANEVAILGNYNGTPRHAVSAQEGIVSKVGAENIVKSAGEADVIIYVGGISPQLEGESMKVNKPGFNGGDRTTIELPAEQRAEIASLAGTGKPVVYVNMSGSAIALAPEAEACAAILQAWYGGECAGEAIADVLFGDVNPSGKLPVTFYKSDADLPDFENYDMAGRTYRYFDGEPLWPFGHGLSYTTFEYGLATLEGEILTIPVTNTGLRDGDEVVQVYIRRDEDTEGPRMSLKGFKRVNVLAGRTVKVEITLDDEAYKTFNPSTGEIELIPGNFTIFYGGSSDAKSLRQLHVKSHDFTIHLLGDSTMAPKNWDRGDLERGWGMYFPNFFKDNVRVVNYARNGRSAQSIIREGRWDRVVRNLKPGDYLFVELGHNDEKIDKQDKNRYAWGGFSDNLRMFVRTAIEKGVHPVLLSPVARRHFDNGKIIQTHEQYPAAIEAVAKEFGIPYIDMNKATTEFLESLGDEASKPYFMWLEPNVNPVYPMGRQDNTHSVARGAHKNAAIVCDSIKTKVPALAPFLLEKPYNLVVAQNGSGDFMTVQEAVNAAPDCAGGEFTIMVRQGTYKECVTIPSTKTGLRIIGEGADRTVISWDNAARKPLKYSKGTTGTFGSSTVYALADNLLFEDITIENCAGRGELVGQALAIFTDGNNIIFRRCSLLGWQDTVYTHGKYDHEGKFCRNAFIDCYIEGSTDFIFGSSIAWFENCEIHSKKNSYITAASTPKEMPFGYVFNNCRLTASPEADKVYLGRPWRPYAKVVFINCEMGSHIRPEGWHNWGKPENEKTAYYAEYGCTGEGSDTSARVKWAHQLKAKEAAKYTYENVILK